MLLLALKLKKKLSMWLFDNLGKMFSEQILIEINLPLGFLRRVEIIYCTAMFWIDDSTFRFHQLEALANRKQSSTEPEQNFSISSSHKHKLKQLCSFFPKLKWLKEKIC